MDKNKSLVKREDRWDLYDENGHKIASTLQGCSNMISFKNCQAIERGYDLDELAEKEFPILTGDLIGITLNQQHSRKDFKKGFQKALELMGDKNFSEFLDKEKELGISDIKTIERIQWYYNTYFDKSQKTEWDVEVEMEWVQSTSILGNPHQTPKLDAEGCLILKLKSE